VGKNVTMGLGGYALEPVLSFPEPA